MGHINIFSYKYVPMVVINPLVDPTRCSLLVIFRAPLSVVRVRFTWLILTHFRHCVMNEFVHFFFLNEHSGTLSEFYCISFELCLFVWFCSSYVAMKEFTSCVYKCLWYNQNESLTRWPFMLDVTKGEFGFKNIIRPVYLSVFLRCIQVVLYQFCDPRTLIILFLYTI